MSATACPDVISRRSLLEALLAPVALLACAGCEAVGPSAIANGRALYNDVITRTGDEQVLDMIVRCRYDETFGMLEVASVTSQVRVGASTEVNAGMGPEEGYDGNLVPFAAGLSYEESPTISYVPLSGEEFITRLVAPVSVVQALTLSRLCRVPGQTFSLMVSRMNGLRNTSGSGVDAAGFRRVSELFHELDTLGVGDIVTSDGKQYVYLYDYKDAHAEDKVRELLELLRLTALQPDGRDLLIPVGLGLGRPPKGDEILVETRSVLDLVRMVGDSIEVPGDHVAAGLVAPVEPAADQLPFVRIRSSHERPANATVAVSHHDWWFYIDATDIPSKRDFVLLRAVLRVGLENPISNPSAPLLTIPVRG